MMSFWIDRAACTTVLGYSGARPVASPVERTMGPYRYAHYVDWDSYFGDALARPLPAVHYHGFSWIGEAGLIYAYKHQSLRTPGTDAFRGSKVPPDMLTWNLLRPHLVEGTWTDAAQAAAWMRSFRDQHAPSHWLSAPANDESYHRVQLRLGRHTVWTWRLPGPGGNTVARTTVICCPCPGVRCPAPPA